MNTYLLAAAAVENVPDLDKTVDLIENSGIETVLSAVVVIALMTGMGLLIWWLKRKLSGDYIHKDKVIEYVKEHKPEKIKPSVKELADLRDHDAFDMWDREIRYCESMTIRDPDGSLNKVKTDIARDIVQWTIRANRNTFKKILDEAYNLVEKDPDTFEEYFGDPKSFQHIVNKALTQIKTAITYKLKDDLKMPDNILVAFDQYRAEVHETMRDMLQLAVTNHTNNYWRMHEVLNSQYAFTRTLRLSVTNFIMYSQIDFSEIEYIRRDGEGTLPTFSVSTRNSSNGAGSIFDYPQ